MKRTLLMASIMAMAVGWLPAQGLNIRVGLFTPALDSELWKINLDNLAFVKRDMNNVNYSAEYELFLNRFASIGFEIGNYTRTRETQYREYEHDDHSPIYQSLSLKITPIEAVLTLYLLGHRTTFSPYLAVGGGIFAWTYEQWGEFIDFSDPVLPINEGHAITQTVSPGASLRFGLLFRPQRMVGFSVEGKYQYLKGKLSGDFEDFDSLDMSGLVFSAGLHIYFD